EQRGRTMSDSIRTDVYEFLGRQFPGSTLDDGYFFVQIKAPIVRDVRRDRANTVLDKLCDTPTWLITVNNDPRDLIEATRVEQGTTSYNPDWNHSEDVPQWLAELPARPRVDLDALRKRSKPLGALAVISPDHRIVFNVHYMRVYAATEDDLGRFL